MRPAALAALVALALLALWAWPLVGGSRARTNGFATPAGAREAQASAGQPRLGLRAAEVVPEQGIDADSGREVVPAEQVPSAPGGAPSIMGRVVEPDGRPAAGAWVYSSLLGKQELERAPVRGWMQCDPDGKFRIPSHGFRRGELDVRSEEGRTQLQVDWIPGTSHDLGDVRLASARSVWLRIVDQAGAPLEGATVETVEAAPIQSEWSEPEACCKLPNVDPAVTAVLVSSPECLPMQFVLPAGKGTRELPLEVRMQALPALIVDVTVRDGAKLPERIKLDVDLQDPGPFVGLDGSRSGEYEPGSQFSTKRPIARRGFGSDQVAEEDPRRLRFELGMRSGLGAESRVHVPGLRPESPLELRVVDELGRSSEPRQVLPAQLDARERVELALQQVPGRLRVRVTDHLGEPISNAVVHGSADRSLEVPTDAKGEALLVAWPGPAEVWVQSGRLAPAAFAVTVAEDPQVTEQVVVLHPGSSLRVRAADGEGRPVPIDAVTIAWNGQKIASSREAEPQSGFHELEGLPEAELEVKARVAGVEHVRRHAPGAGDLLLDVPAVGGLELVLDQGLNESLQAVLQSESDPRLRYAVWMYGEKLVPMGPVLPGTYTLTLTEWAGPSEEPLERRMGLRVVAGETTRVPMAVAHLRRRLDAVREE